MKQSIIATCIFREDDFDFFVDTDQSAFNKLTMQKIVEKFRRPPFKSQLISETKKIQDASQIQFQTSIDLSRNKIPGTIVLNQNGKCLIYNCDSLTSAKKLALLTVRDLNKALRTKFRMHQFSITKIKMEAKLDRQFQIDKIHQFFLNAQKKCEQNVIRVFRTVQKRNRESINNIKGFEFRSQNGQRNAIYSDGTLVIWGNDQSQMKKRTNQIKALLYQICTF